LTTNQRMFSGDCAKDLTHSSASAVSL